MTRINVVPVRILSDKHLVAENHELPRVINLAQKAHDAGRTTVTVDRYTMGQGHVCFFYDKQVWVRRRLMLLNLEMNRRGMNPDRKVLEANMDRSGCVPDEFQKDWQETPDDIDVNLKRLHERDPDHYAQYNDAMELSNG